MVEDMGATVVLAKYVLPLTQLLSLLLTICICVYLRPLRNIEIITVAIFVFSIVNALSFGLRKYLRGKP